MNIVSGKYTLTFSDKQWDEIESLAFPGFEPSRDAAMSRGEWMAIENMLLGKAHRLERGDFSFGKKDREDKVWAGELRLIADVIYKEFKSGDGKI